MILFNRPYVQYDLLGADFKHASFALCSWPCLKAIPTTLPPSTLNVSVTSAKCQRPEGSLVQRHQSLLTAAKSSRQTDFPLSPYNRHLRAGFSFVFACV